MDTPQRTHVYQNHHLDSTRWDRVEARDDDIIIATPYKSGTTWMQEIVLHLVFLGQEIPFRRAVTVWVDARFRPIEELAERIEDMTHRRFLKTHLPLDGLPFYPSTQYVVVGRDARDVFMSLWNHYTSHTPDFFDRLNSLPDRVGAPFPTPPEDIHDFWNEWIGRGWFAWEQEGYPYWGNMHHIQSWWQYRHLPNILFVHFEDLLADTPGQIRRVADFLGIAASDEESSQIAQATSLTAMRTRELEHSGQANASFASWVDGTRSFFYKGTNGRWRNVLSEVELAEYDAKAAAVLSPDCRAWLEQGMAALQE